MCMHIQRNKFVCFPIKYWAPHSSATHVVCKFCNAHQKVLVVQQEMCVLQKNDSKCRLWDSQSACLIVQ